MFEMLLSQRLLEMPVKEYASKEAFEPLGKCLRCDVFVTTKMIFLLKLLIVYSKDKNG